ncbi:ribonuclease E [Thermocatellispora tengchongensis]|uniref:Ribonuclease E n=1 Tax=Thermocatellispora tengchongensis TaxID=1073253 RepID=A0A840PCZ4_9ACTN|nr:Rne/Rng family ribonuclease [Thermocatellispora tengchongensis]MBB5135037.1 ribonuclease E [Thermocatellispora tengchongensis]
MLDNEPIAGADSPARDTTEQPTTTTTTTVTKVRRRAASRPAGPPPEEAERAAGLITTPAPEPSAAPEPPAAEQAAASSAADAVAVSSAAEPAAVSSAAEPAAEQAAASSAAEAAPIEPAAEPAEPAAPARAKRASRRKAAAAEEGAPEGEAAPVKKTSRSRSTATATATTTTRRRTKKAETEDAPAPAAEEAPVKRRRTRKKAEEAPAPAETAELNGTVPGVDVPPATSEALEHAETEVAAALGYALPEDEPLDDELAGEDLVDDLADDLRGDLPGHLDEDFDVEDDLDTDEDTEEDADEDTEEDEDEESGVRDGLGVRRPGLLSDPFGLAAQEQMRAAPAVSFQAPSVVFTPLFQAPDPRLVEQLREQAAREEALREPLDEGEEIEDTEDVETGAEEDEGEGDSDEAGGRRRRRRRGGRGRGRARDREEAEESAAEAEGGEPEAEEEPAEKAEAETAAEEEATGSRRRRRRRRRGVDEGVEPAADDPPNTVVRIRAPRAGRAGAAAGTSVDEVQSVRGSTRLEAKKQRRREGRELGRRRPPIITESEFLARRESVERVMVVRKQGGRTQIAVLEDGVLVEHYVDREAGQSYVGNVYLGKVQNVLPSMEAAFVDIGKGRNAVLYAGEVNFDTAGLEGQPKRIESALKSGQSVLVQVTKDPMGHKGARLTSQVSLPGRYLVYVPDGSMTGISRKLPDKERTRLKSILKKVMPENAGVIVRTAAEGASEEELGRDVARLSAQWENIKRKAKSASPPELLYSEPDLTIRVVRDVFNEDFSSLVVAGDEMWDTVDEYVKYVAPHLADRLTRWDEDGDVFAAYRIDEQIAKALERKVWLPSGGSLVIDRTEAMTVVDVNTGKFTGQGGNLEETVTRNNLEAAEEIVRQLRLRDIGGIIVIDFIDMVLESNRDLVLRRLLECLARDRTKHQVAEVTSLGLVQMTRKRVGQGLLEAFSTPCECCNGRGLHISSEPVDGKPEPRGTQGKMAVEKAVAEKLSKNGDGSTVAAGEGTSAVAAGNRAGRDTVTDALDDGLGDSPDGPGQATQTSGRGRRRSRRAKSAE